MKNKYISKNIILYGADSENSFNLVKDLRNQFNHKVWTIVSGVASIYFLAMFLSAFFVNVVKVNAILYGIMFVVTLMGCILLRTFLTPGHPAVLCIVYTEIAALLAFGVFIGVVLSPDFIAATYHVLIICLPLVIVDKPYRIGLMEIVASVVFLIMCFIFKDGDVRDLDVFNVIVFTFLAQFVNYYMAHTKMEQFITLKRTELSDITDGLTGLFNRKAYAAYIDRYESERIDDDIVIVAFDLNGLKAANDNMGHAAGDELLIGAADCIKKSFSSYGTIYRVGGDEFISIIKADRKTLDAIKSDFKKTADEWKGALVRSLSISVGYAACSDYPEMNITELSKIADSLMYEDKENYYLVNGKSRG